MDLMIMMGRGGELVVDSEAMGIGMVEEVRL
jgi:hypothetical protein